MAKKKKEESTVETPTTTVLAVATEEAAPIPPEVEAALPESTTFILVPMTAQQAELATEALGEFFAIKNRPVENAAAAELRQQILNLVSANAGF